MSKNSQCYCIKSFCISNIKLLSSKVLMCCVDLMFVCNIFKLCNMIPCGSKLKGISKKHFFFFSNQNILKGSNLSYLFEIFFIYTILCYILISHCTYVHWFKITNKRIVLPQNCDFHFSYLYRKHIIIVIIVNFLLNQCIITWVGWATKLLKCTSHICLWNTAVECNLCKYFFSLGVTKEFCFIFFTILWNEEK